MLLMPAVFLVDLLEPKPMHDSEISLDHSHNPDAVRRSLSRLLADNANLEIDLSRLKNLSPSFAFQVFGRIYLDDDKDILAKISFKNDGRNLSSRVIAAIERAKRISEVS